MTDKLNAAIDIAKSHPIYTGAIIFVFATVTIFISYLVNRTHPDFLGSRYDSPPSKK